MIKNRLRHAGGNHQGGKIGSGSVWWFWPTMAGLYVITIAAVVALPRVYNRVALLEVAEDWPFGAWLECAAGPRPEIATDALRVPYSVMLRVTPAMTRSSCSCRSAAESKHGASSPPWAAGTIEEGHGDGRTAEQDRLWSWASSDPRPARAA